MAGTRRQQESQCALSRLPVLKVPLAHAAELDIIHTLELPTSAMASRAGPLGAAVVVSPNRKRVTGRPADAAPLPSGSLRIDEIIVLNGTIG